MNLANYTLHAFAGILLAPLLSGQPTQSINPTATFQESSYWLGLNHSHKSRRNRLENYYDALSASVCVFDFNSDGFDDLLFTTGPGDIRRFGKRNWWNNHPNLKLYQNEGGQYFSDKSQLLAYTGNPYTTTCHTADMNADGKIDILLGTFGDTYIFLNQGSKGFIEAQILNSSEQSFTTHIETVDLDQDHRLDVLIGKHGSYKQDDPIFESEFGHRSSNERLFHSQSFKPARDQVFLQQPDGSFKSTEKSLNKTVLANRTLRIFLGTDSNSIQTLNDSKDPNNATPTGLVWLSRARDFKKIPLNQTMHWAIARNDGYGLSLYTPDSNLDKAYSNHYKSALNGIKETWSLLSEDFNHDGFEDLFTANGKLAPNPNSPSLPIGQSNQVALQGNFKSEVNFSHKQLGSPIHSTRGSALTDLNNDGKMDIVSASNNGQPEFYINRSTLSKPWIGFQCTPSNLCGTTKININGKEEPLYKERKQFMGQSSNKLRFFLAAGHEQELVDIKLNGQRHRLKPGFYYRINLSKGNLMEIVPKPVIPKDIHTILNAPEVFLIHAKHASRMTQNLKLSPYTKFLTESQISLILEASISNDNKTMRLLLSKIDSEQGLPTHIKSSYIDYLLKLEDLQSFLTLSSYAINQNTALACKALYSLMRLYREEEALPKIKQAYIDTLIYQSSRLEGIRFKCFSIMISETENISAIAIAKRLDAESLSELDDIILTNLIDRLRRAELLPLLDQVITRNRSTLSSEYAQTIKTRILHPAELQSNLNSKILVAASKRIADFWNSSMTSKSVINQQNDKETITAESLLEALEKRAVVQNYIEAEL